MATLQRLDALCTSLSSVIVITVGVLGGSVLRWLVVRRRGIEVLKVFGHQAAREHLTQRTGGSSTTQESLNSWRSLCLRVFRFLATGALVVYPGVVTPLWVARRQPSPPIESGPLPYARGAHRPFWCLGSSFR